MASREPPAGFARAALDLTRIAPGQVFGRIYDPRFPEPLGYGKARSRFSDPRRRSPENRFGVLYLGSSLKVCFLEALLRDERDGLSGDYLMDERDLDTHSFAQVEVREELTLLDLTGDAPVRMGIPSDVPRSSKQALARRWSLAVYEHPARVDGIHYPSRLNGEVNLAIYDRAIGKLAATATMALRDAPELARVLNGLKVALI